ncbi:hypothetical protein COLO4_29320 [Corchorus olitorius]|uniref:Uncharacterized protein n=1 Tax=Corchorus olitorius TaxID=93759 RepID=A0A1R3HF92_9ROSI|nr:hypothetical protein COLO4_29320 [Corchorus olitorius]
MVVEGVGSVESVDGGRRKSLEKCLEKKNEESPPVCAGVSDRLGMEKGSRDEGC